MVLLMKHKNTQFLWKCLKQSFIEQQFPRKKNNNNKLLKVFAQCKQSIFLNKTFKINIPESTDIDS